MPPWFNDFLGVAYRYYDLRMNVVPLFSDKKEANSLWYDTIHWWLEPSIKFRFVETGKEYWFILGADSQKPQSNKSFFKVLPHSTHYERFKRGHEGEAYLRFGMYSKKNFDEAKGDTQCECGHISEEHDEDDASCLYEDCGCKMFESFQVNLLKRKKTVTDIVFLKEQDVKDDPLAWNCFNANKYSKT
ncbi:MAG: hypothetical protein GWN01_16165 [Nitrosopumilaceae archaeon]|nr:hypothetical protein [Nitrosopumilaceae archaeon]NIU02372.1 hypothetical protein [Nitrosopumilaceae archaeon]NIU88829.1 hypothetical protein [Nitrosopumilaceae archaeon]NIV66954.1 hypothetical protein [Nitrosopumilaceae archaeon]NIX62973.1 hypothetical protein [Nitrosopumilaceae archaeon]